MYRDPHTTMRPFKPFAEGGEGTNSAVKFPVTVGHKVSAPTQIALRDIAHVIRCVQTGLIEGQDILGLVATIRNLPNAELAKAMKQSLPWFCCSVCEKRRSNETVKSAQFAVFDLDHVPDIEGAKSLALAKLPFLRWAFRSVRDGVKLIAQFSRPVTVQEDFRLLWRYLALQVERTLKLKVDPAPDWSRACFFSYDPELLANPRCKPLEVGPALKEAEFVLQMARGGKMSMPCPDRENPAPTLVIPGAVVPESERSEVWGEVTRDPVFRSTAEHQSPECDQGMENEETGSRVKPGMTRRQDLADGKEAGSGSGNAPSPTSPLHHSTTEETTLPPFHRSTVPPSEADSFEKARRIVQKLAQSQIDYMDWIRTGMALYVAFGERGRELWFLFLDNPHYRDTEYDLAMKWRSFRNVREITLDTLFHLGGKYGCQV